MNDLLLSDGIKIVPTDFWNGYPNDKKWIIVEADGKLKIKFKMNQLSIVILKVLRKAYAKVFQLDTLVRPDCEQNSKVVSEILMEKLMSESPCMIARFGSNELLCLISYLGIKQNNKDYLSYISGKSDAWWWNEKNLENMHLVAGFFPPLSEKYEQFCELLLKDIAEIDILGSWLENEQIIQNKIRLAQKVEFRLLEPFWADIPWTKALEGKKVLVIHPFVNEIVSQFQRRSLLFKEEILPPFDLITLKAVQSYAGISTEFADWFEALDYMKSEIDKIEFDICLIGAGAYGLHLAAHVKRQGKKGFHLGGALQLLFGIRGKRWEDPNYGVEKWGLAYGSYSNLINEYWVRPGEGEKPKNANSVEGACYW